MQGIASPLGSAGADPFFPLALRLKSLGIDGDGLEAIIQTAQRPLRVAAGADVVRAGEPKKHSTVLLAGMTCAYERGEDGARSILSFHHAGDFCDLHQYVSQERGGAFGVQALTDVTVAVVDYRDMDRLLARPELALVFWRATMLEVAIYRERLMNMNRGTALERVAHLLCEQLARREAVGLRSARLPISQIDIADATGLSVVHVNRTIQTLRSRNMLSKATQSIEVIDRKQLAQIARFDGSYLNFPDLLKWAVQIVD